MTENYVLASSGFLLPDVEFWKVNPEPDLSNELERAQSYKFKDIHKFPIQNKPRPVSMFERTYSVYLSDKSFDNWLVMVDVLSQVFVEEGSFIRFIRAQVNNPFLSPSGFRVALSLLDSPRNREATLDELINVPNFYLNEGSADLGELTRRKDRLAEYDKYLDTARNLDVLKSLVGIDPKYPALFFKYVFTGGDRRAY